MAPLLGHLTCPLPEWWRRISKMCPPDHSGLAIVRFEYRPVACRSDPTPQLLEETHIADLRRSSSYDVPLTSATSDLRASEENRREARLVVCFGRSADVAVVPEPVHPPA